MNRLTHDRLTHDRLTNKAWRTRWPFQSDPFEQGVLLPGGCRRRSLLRRLGRLAAEWAGVRHACGVCWCVAGRHKLVLTICGSPPILTFLFESSSE